MQRNKVAIGLIFGLLLTVLAYLHYSYNSSAWKKSSVRFVEQAQAEAPEYRAWKYWLESETELTRVIKGIYAEVTGPIDRWWRSKDWIARELCLQWKSPIQLDLLLQQIRLEMRLNLLEYLKRSTLKDSGMTIKDLRFWHSALSHKTSHQWLVEPEWSTADVMRLYEELGSELMGAYNENSNKTSQLKALKTAFQKSINKFVENGLDQSLEESPSMGFYPRRTGLALRLSYIGQKKETLEKALLTWILFHEEMAHANLDALENLQDLLSETFSAEKVILFTDSLTGFFNSMEIAVKMNIPGAKDSPITNKFHEHIGTDDQIALSLQSVVNSFDEIIRNTNIRYFDEVPDLHDFHSEDFQEISSEDSDSSVPVVEDWLSEYPTSTIYSEAMGSVDTLAGGGLIIAGILGTPLSKGGSLLVSIAGAAIMVVDATIQGVMQKKKHQFRVLTLLRMHEVLASQLNHRRLIQDEAFLGMDFTEANSLVLTAEEPLLLFLARKAHAEASNTLPKLIEE